MSNSGLWNCDTKNTHQIVCVLSKFQNLWLRAVIEKHISESEVGWLYIEHNSVMLFLSYFTTAMKL